MEISYNIYSSIGLGLDIIGAVLLFIYGLPSKVSGGSGFLNGESLEDERKRKRRNRFIYRMARVGLILLIVGFGFQLIGANISNLNDIKIKLSFIIKI